MAATDGMCRRPWYQLRAVDPTAATTRGATPRLGRMPHRIETSLTRMLDLDVPIVQAPIGGLAIPQLAAAVANAGGLGMLALTWRDPDELPGILAETRQLTDRSFGVNLILAENDQAERVRLCLEHGVRLISFFWGDPARFLPEIHAAGALATLTVGSAEEARQAVAAGVDIVVAQGWEAGGHVWGEVASLPLIPAVVDAAGHAPVIAAGGIADGRGVAAVLALGAAGAWIGTRFVMSEEAPSHPTYRELLAAAQETDTVHSRLFDVGWPDAPHRTLRNSTMDAWVAAGRPASGQRPGEEEQIAVRDGEPLVRYGSSSPHRDARGEVEAMSLWSGQSVGLVDEVLPAATIVARLADEAVGAIERLRGTFKS